MSELRLSDELLKLLGEADFLRLVGRYGGIRLFVPPQDISAIAAELGDDVAAKLGRAFAGTYIRVPLARDLRARHYRKAGFSNAEIARTLGITETGVDKLFHRMPNKPGKRDTRQADLFSR